MFFKSNFDEEMSFEQLAIAKANLKTENLVEEQPSAHVEILDSLKVAKRTALEFGGYVAGVINDDALEGLKTLPSDIFNVVVTSPPYYWVRDYGYEGQIGHEDSPDEFVKKLVRIFREVKRVLHPEGVCYLNIADTYYSGNGQPHGSDPRSSSRNFMRKKMRAVDRSGWDIPKKSLIGIPWKLAFAMQADGWTLRSDIIWKRANSLKEPTALDRPYRQHEHLFLFSKARFYSYDRSVLLEDKVEDVWDIDIERNKRIEHNAAFPSDLVRRCIRTGAPKGGFVLDPFLGSGTTIDVALEEGRNAVGIDLSAIYAHEVVGHLTSKGYREIDWQKFEANLTTEPKEWATWNGNKNNFKKSKRPVNRKKRDIKKIK